MNPTPKKVLIVANNNTFTTWSAKTQYVLEFYSPLLTLQFEEIKQTKFENIPVVEIVINASLPAGQPESTPCNAYVIDPIWYDENIISLAAGYDCVIFAVNTTDIDPVTGLIPAGLNSGSFDGIDRITIFVEPESELWPAEEAGIIYPNAIAFFMAHEISHWLYSLFKAPADNTHEYFYSPNPAGVIPELKQAMDNQPTQTAASPAPKFSANIIKWAQAIQRQEGTGETARNVRDNNPGNLRATSYALSLGKTTSVDSLGVTDGGKGFCIYESYAIGFDALCTLLTDACLGDLIAFKPNMSLLQFTQVYAEPPNENYALAVAAAIGVPVTMPIVNLLAA